MRFLMLCYVMGLVFISSGASAWTNQSTFQIETGLQLNYVIATPQDPSSITSKLPILIFEEGDGTAGLMLNDSFLPAQMLAQLQQASSASGIVWAVPELRRQYYAGQELQICQLDFNHRQADLEAFIDQMKQLPFVDSTNIFLVGHSAGADTVTHVTQDRSDIRGTINLAGGVSSCSEESDGKDCPSGLNSLLQYQCSGTQNAGRIGTWWRQLFLESNLFSRISILSTPYLAMLGDQDAVVSLTDFQNYSAQLSKLNSAFQSVVLPDVDHGSIVTSPQAMQMMIQFINQNLRKGQ